MIISPPFQIDRDVTVDDEAWVAAAMPEVPERLYDTGNPEGQYPLSHNLLWHNGMHLSAPRHGGVPAPVRAVADGKVVFASPPTPVSSDPTHALNYNPFARDGASPAWTDNGCVILEHRTEIGAAAGVATAVVFYSVYMHLSALGRIKPSAQEALRRLQRDDVVLRKHEIGTTGHIYGNPGQIHFEICCNRTSLQQFIGRAPNWVDSVASAAPVADGRIDCVFGALLVYLPASAPIDRGTAQPPGSLQVAATASLGTPLWVRLKYGGGNCRCESYDAQGRLIGVAPPEPEAEYRLSLHAAQRHHAVPLSSRADTSSPSGWYELLRFGRNLGIGNANADKDLLPANASHWRRIIDSNGVAVWADLNADGSRHFSDADFLPVMGWNCVDDDLRPTDQRCESDHLNSLIRDPDPANTDRMDPLQLARRLSDVGVRKALRRVICQFPCEWNKEDIVSRHEFVRQLPAFKGNDPAWSRFEKHLLGLSFAGLPAEYLNADWHWHPQEFIATFARCGWLSPTEFAQIYKTTPQTTRATYLDALNVVTRKYLYASNPLRLSHFLGQGAIESNFLRTMQEASMTGHVQGNNFHGVAINATSLRNESELGHWYGAIPAEDDAWFRSTKFNSHGHLIASSYNWRNGNLGDPDAQKFRGRGFKQLTGRLNYSKYWVFRGWLDPRTFDDSWWVDPHYAAHDAAHMQRRPAIVDDPQRSTQTPYNCIDTGG